jgi:uncharacterized membrane protein YdbT with pleckstrin-like domain
MPTFPRKLLAEHETLIFDKRPHWVALIPATFWTIVIIVAGAFLLNWVDDPNWAKWVILLVALVAFMTLAVYPFLQWLYTNFVLTTDRLITRAGVIAKNSKEIPLERINDVTFTQSIVERMIGAGDLMVESAGERGQTRITNVRDPEGTQLTIYKETEKNNDRMMGRGEPVKAEASIPEQIEALARLKEQGVISASEFETKKQELLRRL